MKKSLGPFLLAALLTALGGASLLRALEPASSDSSRLPRAGVGVSGGAAASSSYRLGASVGEAVAASTAAPAGLGSALGPGLRQLLHFPGAVTTLTGVEGAELTSTTLRWTAPGYDGRMGALAPWTTYYVRVASFTAPDTFRYLDAVVVVSTKDTAPGAAVSTPTYGLLSNTTYYAQLWTKDAGGNLSYASNRSTFVTLARLTQKTAPTDDPFLADDGTSRVFFTSATARWAALPTKPPEVDSMTAVGYVLEASSTDFGALSPGGVVSSSFTYSVRASTLVVSEPPLATNKVYHFRVGTLNHAGVVRYLVLGSTKTKLQPVDPAAVDPPFTAVSSGAMIVHWDSNGNADQTIYTLETSDAWDFSSPATTSSGTFNVFVATVGLAANTTYYYRVKASTDGADSAVIPLPSTATLTLVPEGVPDSFPLLHVSSLTLAWSANGNPLNLSSYTLALSTGEDWPNAFEGNVYRSTSPAGALPAATLLGLLSNTTYHAFAAGLNHGGAASAYAALGATSTLTAQPLMLPPSFAEVFEDGFFVRWDAAGNALALTTYTLEASASESFSPAETDKLLVSTVPDAGPGAAFSGLNGNTTYYLRARALNHNGVPSDYRVLEATSTLALAPSSLDFEGLPPTEDALRLDWSGGTNRAGTEHQVNVSTDPSFGYGAPVTTHAVTTLFLSSGTLLANTTYHFRVRAVNNNGLSSVLVYASTSTLSRQPALAAPTFAQVHGTSMTVRWLRNDNPLSRTTYTIELSVSPSFDPFELDRVAFATAPVGDVPTATFTGLTLNATYYLRIGALNHNAVPSAWLEPGSTSTLAGLPTGAEVPQVYFGSMTATWDLASPPPAGWELRGSSTAFNGKGQVYISSYPAGGLTALTLYGNLAAGMWPNTTHYLRLGALNWNTVPNVVEVSSRSTLARQVSNASYLYNAINGVFATSASVTWNALPSAAVAGDSAACQGYVVEATTTDAFGVTDWTGEVLSSTTLVYSVGNRLVPSTLTVIDLNPGTTYAFRVGTLNHENAAHYVHLPGTRTIITPFTWTGAGGNGLWYTATNWNPNGVPNAGSPVTIALNNARVRALVTNAPISFSSMTLGKVDGSVSVNLDIATTIVRGGSVLVYPNAGLTLATTYQLYFNGDATFVRGSSLSHRINTTGVNVATYAVVMRVAGTFDLQGGSTIAVSTNGFQGGAANGGDGSGTGAGFGDTASNGGGSGAGHGGTGGQASINVGGSAYDSRTSPMQLGSGGGGGDTAAANGGGRGGGCVRIEADTFKLDGLIAANGGRGNNGTGGSATTGAGGGGSGGTVYLKADYFIGSGTITAFGGDGGTDTDNGDDPGGGGGGGRVSIDVTVGGNTCDLFVSTHGGLSGGGTSGAGGDGSFSSTVTLPSPSLVAVVATSDTVHWNWSTVYGAKDYQLFSSTGGLGQSPVLEPSATSYTETGLDPNTLHTRFVRVSACGNAADSAEAALATLARPPRVLAQPFLNNALSSITVAWAAWETAPQKDSCSGYRLEASSTDFGASAPGGLVLTSETAKVLASTLTVAGLDPNTTYYYRVAALNVEGSTSVYAVLGASATLAFSPAAAAEVFPSVHIASITAEWEALPTAAADAASKSAAGYWLEASSTNFGALLPGGLVYSSRTYSLAASSLTIGAGGTLDRCATYYFRLASLSYNVLPNYQTLGSTMTLNDWGANFSVHSVDIGNIDVNTEHLIPTGFVVSNGVACPATLQLKAEVVTSGGSPWSVASSSGTDTLTVQALFDAAQPAATDFTGEDLLAETPLQATGTRFAGGQNGAGLIYLEERTLWLKIGMPRISSTDLPQDLRVTVYGYPP
ncbi:MAG: hypothetical protein WC969_09200 [Elusimicrobiota bacterium]|jgi:hypothetical protein